MKPRRPPEVPEVRTLSEENPKPNIAGKNEHVRKTRDTTRIDVMEVFKLESPEEKVEKIIESRGGVMDNGAALAIIKAGMPGYVAENIRIFDNLSIEVALLLIERYFAPLVLANIHKFHASQEDLRRIKDKIVHANQGLVLLGKPAFEFIISFNDLMTEMIEWKDGSAIVHLRERGLFSAWAEYVLARKSDLSRHTLVALMNAANYRDTSEHQRACGMIRSRLGAFREIGEEEILKILDTPAAEYGALCEFYWIGGELVQKMSDRYKGNEGNTGWNKIEKQKTDHVVGIHKRRGEPAKIDIGAEMIRGSRARFNSYDEYIKWLERSFDKDEILEARRTKKNFEAAVLESAMKNKALPYLLAVLQFFEECSQAELAAFLISNGEGQILIDERERFTELDLPQILERLAKARAHDLILENIGLFGQFFDIDNLDRIIELDLLDFYFENRAVIHPREIEDTVLAQKILAKNAFILAKRLKHFEALERHIAHGLVISGYGQEVLKNIERFQDLDIAEVKAWLIENKQPQAVARAVDEIVEYGNYRETSQSLAAYLIENDKIDALAKNLDNFTGLDHVTLKALVAAGFARKVVRNLDSFRAVNQECAEVLINAGQLLHVMEHKGSFKDTDWERLVADPSRLVATGNGAYVTEHIGEYPAGTAAVIFGELLRTEQALQIAHHPEAFPMYSHDEMARKLIDEGAEAELVANLGKFKNLSAAVFQLLAGTFAHRMVNNLDAFTGLGEAEARILIDEKFSQIVWMNVGKFGPMTREKIVEYMISIGRAEFITEKILAKTQPYANLDEETLLDLLLQGGQKEVIKKNIGRFSNLEEQSLYRLRDVLGIGGILDNLKIFSNLGTNVFRWLNDLGVSTNAVPGALAENLGSFKGLNEEVYVFLMNQRYEDETLSHLSSFRGLSQKVFDDLWKKKKINLLAGNLASFTGIDGRYADKLIKAGHEEEVRQNAHVFTI